MIYCTSIPKCLSALHIFNIQTIFLKKELGFFFPEANNQEVMKGGGKKYQFSKNSPIYDCFYKGDKPTKVQDFGIRKAIFKHHVSTHRT